MPVIISSDPENNPIEDAIAPLVFEIHRLGIVEPCWSCEGHNGLDGKLWKRPAVWFYCDKVVYLRILVDAVECLYVAKELKHQWRIRITYSDEDNPDSAFALEPDSYDLGEALLEDLHGDIRVLTENLYDLVHEHAEIVKNSL